jgi:hypothetical protein
VAPGSGCRHGQPSPHRRDEASPPHSSPNGGHHRHRSSGVASAPSEFRLGLASPILGRRRLASTTQARTVPVRPPRGGRSHVTRAAVSPGYLVAGHHCPPQTSDEDPIRIRALPTEDAPLVAGGYQGAQASGPPGSRTDGSARRHRLPAGGRTVRAGAHGRQHQSWTARCPHHPAQLAPGGPMWANRQCGSQLSSGVRWCRMVQTLGSRGRTGAPAGGPCASACADCVRRGHEGDPGWSRRMSVCRSRPRSIRRSLRPSGPV